jgi:16S rRNA (cytidine1402-2'-O)-methyltransferase
VLVKTKKVKGKLYIVPTPIGNLEDMTFRAIKILNEVDIILAEDTRTSGKLLSFYEIKTHMQPYHMHNEHFVTEKIVEQINMGKNYALISDAGTPAISDPGYLMVRACVQNDISVECLPGATAFVPALVVSGFPINQFLFVGFLPIKKGRKTILESLVHQQQTLVFYESPHKITKTIDDFIQYFGESKKAVVCRELSKKFEEIIRGSLSEIKIKLAQKTIKGEIVVVLSGERQLESQ